MKSEKAKIIWQSKPDKAGRQYRIVVIYLHGEEDNPWYLPEMSGTDAMGKKIWVEWTH